MPKKSVSEWEALFKVVDKDNNGYIDIFEMRDMLRANDCNVTDSQIADSFVYLDGAEGNQKITKEEFVNGMKKLDDFITKLTELFKQVDTDGSGYLDKNELSKLLGSCGHKFTDDEVSQILRKADVSGDGKISFDEFLGACT